MLRLIVLTSLALAFVCPVAHGAETVAVPVDFNRDVRPILARHCFACHGPDTEHRESGLRLDVREAAVRPAESGLAAIVPGQAEQSELLKRLTSKDDDVRMPPQEAGLPLEPAQIALLRRWIDQGANYARHWALEKPRRQPPPAVVRTGWPRNPLDRFILARLESEGLHPAPEAQRQALVRRLSLDLRGLPPTPEEVSVFVQDRGDDAYERLVDRFLADPAYGERWARVWLDLARYADSKGYGSDPLRIIWRYRDWVIGALNRNQPFDQFTIEQVAGDLLPSPTPEQLMATAFHRNTMTNTEGGTDDEEFRVAAVKDRVDTTFQVWMGLTIGCAKCHNHKYDPFSQREYYQLFAIFNQTADADRGDEEPTIPSPTPEILAEIARVDARLAALKKQLDTPTPELTAAQQAWEKKLAVPADWIVLRPSEASSSAGTKLEILSDGRLLAAASSADADDYTIRAETTLDGAVAIRLEALPDASLPAGGSGWAKDGDFVLSKFAVAHEAGEDGKTQPVALARATTDFSRTLFEVSNLVDGKKLDQVGWSVGPQQKQAHAAVFVLAQPLQLADKARLVFTLSHRYKQAGQTLGSFRLSLTTAATAADRGALPAETLALVEKPSESRSEAERQRLAVYYRTLAPSLAPVRAQIAGLEKSRPKIPTLPVMQQLPADKRRATHVLVKGNFLSPSETVEAGLPTALHPARGAGPVDRLALARWLVDRDNPLTARVAANRFWAQLFGTGLVETEEDFGVQGLAPSHPELLDWLAVEFMDRGWDMKSFLKLLVTSATYRQSSAVSRELAERDPDNRLLARGPRFRLEAEMVRDQALSLSGLLSRKMYGPSVFPLQPPGLWQAAFNGERTWATSGGEDRYRRALYTFWRRTIPYPSMATFDAPSRELCALRRIRTNTPLQAFVTLNDPVYVEAAQALARRIMREGGTNPDERARFALALCLARPPQPQEVKRLADLFQSELKHYRQDPKSAAAMATDPLGPLPPGADAAELAAWTVVANVLLNLDAVLMKG